MLQGVRCSPDTLHVPNAACVPILIGHFKPHQRAHVRIANYMESCVWCVCVLLLLEHLGSHHTYLNDPSCCVWLVMAPCSHLREIFIVVCSAGTPIPFHLMHFCPCWRSGRPRVYLPSLELQRQLQAFLYSLQQLVVQWHHLCFTPQELGLHCLLPAWRKQRGWNIPRNSSLSFSFP